MRHPTGCEAVILGILQRASGRFVQTDILIEEVYRGKREPEYALRNMYVFICRLRKKGYRIESSYGLGYRLIPDYQEAIRFVERYRGVEGPVFLEPKELVQAVNNLLGLVHDIQAV